MRVALFTLLFSLFCVPIAFAQEFNAGIVQGLWYSQENVFADETVRVYVAIRNNTGSDLTGTVEFLDNEERIGRKTVQALNGRIIESWVDWKPTYGTHQLSATLSRIELHTVGESTQEVEVTSALAEDTLFADYDTDKDGVGNEQDTDDDGDGISDVQEKEDGTDPLVKNESVEEKEVVEEPEEESETDNESKQEETNSSGTQGIERYLTESPAENVLSGVTTYIHQIKEDLDQYRASRNERAASAKKATSTPAATNGFGEVTRATSTEEDTVWTHDFSLWDFVLSVWALVVTLFNYVYTFLLAVLSWLLGHPVLMQVGLLALILFSLIKLAHKFGSRPKSRRF